MEVRRRNQASGEILGIRIELSGLASGPFESFSVALRKVATLTDLEPSAPATQTFNSQRTTSRYYSWFDTLRYVAQQVNTTPVTALSFLAHALSRSRNDSYRNLTRHKMNQISRTASLYFETDWLYISS
jgi:hypothetical protein